MNSRTAGVHIMVAGVLLALLGVLFLATGADGQGPTCKATGPPGALAEYAESWQYAAAYGIDVPLSARIRRAAERERLDPAVLFELVRVESSFRPRVVSWAGAVGLAQVLPATARELDPTVDRADLFDPETNLRLGAAYLRHLLDRYDGDLERALTAYHWGPRNVERGRFSLAYAGRVLDRDLRDHVAAYRFEIRD